MAATALARDVASVDRVHLFLKLFTAGGFALLGLAIVGELLGWWNDLGELLALIGGIAGAVGLPVTLMYGATKAQADALAGTLEGHTGILHEHAGILDQHTGILQQHTGILHEHTGILHQHTGILQEHGALLREQTSLLRGQIALLADIRDRL